MATLQKIRNRAGILVAIVIGAALFAFIVGDALNSGGALLRGSKTEMAVIADESISIMDFQKRVKHNENIAQMMSGQSALTTEQQEKVRENTWQELVQEVIMTKEYEELGLKVSSDELFELVQGENLSPIVRQIFQDEKGFVDKTRILQVLKQLINAQDGTPQKMYWLNIEDQVKSARQLEKYNELIQKSFFISTPRAKEILENAGKKVDFSYLVKKYSSVADSTVSVSSDEIREYYNSHKYLFEQDETRKIQYVTFNIDPSEEDRAASKKYVTELLNEFKGSKDNKEYVDLNSDLKFNGYFFKKGENKISDLDNFMFTAKEGEVFGPYEEDSFFKVAKINDVKMLPDSVKARHILIQPINNDFAGAKVKADSLANLLRKGADFDKMAREMSADKNSAVNGGDLGWFGPRQMVQPFSDTCFFAKKNKIKVVLTQFGAHVVQVTEQAKPERKVQIAVVAREISASQNTFNKIYSKAVKFAQNVETSEDFSASAEKEGVTKRIGTNIRKNDKTLAGLDKPRELIKAIYTTEEPNSLVKDKEGSAIFELEGKFVIAVLSEINEKGTTPINKVSSSIIREIRRQKKAEIISNELLAASKGSQSLLSLAQKQNLEVKEANEISFESFQIPGAGIEPKVIANAVMTEKGKISKPIEGNQGVYVIIVNNITKGEVSEDALKMTKDKLQNTLIYRMLYQGAHMQALIKNANIDDKRYKFY